MSAMLALAILTIMLVGDGLRKRAQISVLVERVEAALAANHLPRAEQSLADLATLASRSAEYARLQVFVARQRTHGDLAEASVLLTDFKQKRTRWEE